MATIATIPKNSRTIIAEIVLRAMSIMANLVACFSLPDMMRYPVLTLEKMTRK